MIGFKDMIVLLVCFFLAKPERLYYSWEWWQAKWQSGYKSVVLATARTFIALSISKPFHPNTRDPFYLTGPVDPLPGSSGPSLISRIAVEVGSFLNDWPAEGALGMHGPNVVTWVMKVGRAPA